MERLTREMTFEEVKEQWKKDFNELSDCFDMEKGLKHISIF